MLLEAPELLNMFMNICTALYAKQRRLKRRLRDGSIGQRRDDFSPIFSYCDGVLKLSSETGAT
jgi:hypothetical protein